MHNIYLYSGPKKKKLKGGGGGVPITRYVRNKCKISNRGITYVFFLHSYAVYIVYHSLRVHLYIL